MPGATEYAGTEEPEGPEVGPTTSESDPTKCWSVPNCLASSPREEVQVLFGRALTDQHGLQTSSAPVDSGDRLLASRLSIATPPRTSRSSTRSALEDISLGHRKVETPAGVGPRWSLASALDKSELENTAAAEQGADDVADSHELDGDGSREGSHELATARFHTIESADDKELVVDEATLKRRATLDRIITDELRVNDGTASQKSNFSTVSGARSAKLWTKRGVVDLDDVLPGQAVNFWSVLFGSRWFTGFFLVLTMYALYASDLDQLYGDKDSEIAVEYVTTVVCAFFLIELVIHHLGDSSYAFRAYFWLDLFALVSLLPDTIFGSLMRAGGMEENPGELARIIRVVARSSKATRLNRLSRVVRVVAFMPRLQRFIGRRTQDVNRALDKKLMRIFCVLDEDLDGFVLSAMADRCIRKIGNFFQKKQGDSPVWSKAIQDIRRFSQIMGKSGEGSDSDPSQSPATTSYTATASQGHTEVRRFTHSDTGAGTDTQGVSRRGSQSSMLSMDDSMFFYRSDTKESQLLGFAEFKSRVMKDPFVREELLKGCKEEMEEGTNMQSVNSRNSEYIGVKVALLILFLLFVLTMVDVVSKDTSTQWGLDAMDRFVHAQYPQAQGPVPSAVREQVIVWANRPAGETPLNILYLDLDKRVFCDESAAPPLSCDLSSSSTQRQWSARGPTKELQKRMDNLAHRPRDLRYISSPEDLHEANIKLDEVDALAVLLDRDAQEEAAKISLLQTSAIMLVILGAVTAFSKDMSFLWGNLLKPLVDLSDEMESITRLQLAGARAETDEDDEFEAVPGGTSSEIRLIKTSFANMKKAIRSWGKYVPWPVVQHMLREDTSASLEVADTEVSIFFSDVANFTSTVEGLPPEKSLLLLSRYFHDMSKVIDEHEGIVLEYIGDAIMSIYGAPTPNTQHPFMAVKAALKMLSCLRIMNKWFKEQGLPEISIRAGIHTGCALVGNMGFESRLKYGIIGEEANVPSRLEELNKSFKSVLLISKATHDRLPEEQFIMRPVDFLYLTPGADSEPVYQVLQRHRDVRVKGSTATVREACLLHHEAMAQYRERDFQAALKQFSKVNEMMSEVRKQDRPSELFVDRCKEYISRPPPDNWDGVWDGG